MLVAVRVPRLPMPPARVAALFPENVLFEIFNTACINSEPLPTPPHEWRYYQNPFNVDAVIIVVPSSLYIPPPVSAAVFPSTAEDKIFTVPFAAL